MQPATPDFTQQNSNAPITSFIHPEDQKTMISAIDTARLGGKGMSKKQRLKLEEESARIAEGYKMQMPSSFGGLANVFDQQLQQQPVTPNFALNPRNIATPEMQAQILQELASLGQNTQGMQTPFPVGQQPTTPQVARQAEQPQSDLQAEQAKENKLLEDKDLLRKAKNYKSAESFENKNNPMSGSAIWDDKPKNSWENDFSGLRINMFPTELLKGKGLTKNYMLNLLKEAYDKDISKIIPSYGSYTKDGISFMDKLVNDGWVSKKGSNYEIESKIKEWRPKYPLQDIWNKGNSK